MSTIDELAVFCKDQAEYHARKATERGIKPAWIAKHQASEAKFKEIAEFLEARNTAPPATDDPAGHIQSDLFALSPFDLDDLPSDVVDELKISKADTADSQIIELLKIAGRPLSISEMLVGLFRKFQVTHKRTALSARLYRMSQAEMIEQATERGTYTLPVKRHPGTVPIRVGGGQS